MTPLTKDQQSREEFEPCAYCSSRKGQSLTNSEPDIHRVLCQWCGALGPAAATSEEAIAKWNAPYARLTPAALPEGMVMAPRDALETLLETGAIVGETRRTAYDWAKSILVQAIKSQPPSPTPESAASPPATVVKCETCGDEGVIHYRSGQTAESYEEGSIPCPDCGEFCERCGGQGTISVLDGAGPDAREVDVDCPACKGECVAPKQESKCVCGQSHRRHCGERFNMGTEWKYNTIGDWCGNQVGSASKGDCGHSRACHPSTPGDKK